MLRATWWGGLYIFILFSACFVFYLFCFLLVFVFHFGNLVLFLCPIDAAARFQRILLGSFAIRE